ncbi:Rv3654c family TadE-like protein [Leifsonia sp. AG29]|uniref:Rv3654c family TadE-like protein n=1 Tax=Leifsonia sp. AG29 TaxID=2598860 RepID=UPI00131D001E|nr:Rv3654c family TadE-like protein [Leifsonia sp. AG29]
MTRSDDREVRPPRQRDQGSGSVLAIMCVACVAALLSVLLGAAGVLLTHRRAVAAAELAALAGAEVAVGRVAGSICEAADRVASSAGAVVDRCDVDGLVVTVTATVGSGALRTSGTARAGPPHSP